jgi:hypothetical protein
MRPWAQWTAKTALLVAGFAAAAGGLSGVALAAGGSASSDASPGLSPGRLVAPAGLCDNASALLGVNALPGTGSFTSGPLTGLQQVSGLAPIATAPPPLAGSPATTRAASSVTRPAPLARATRTFRQHSSWPDKGPCRASRTCPCWLV